MNERLEELRRHVNKLLSTGRAPEAETLLLRERSGYRGRDLGRIELMYAQTWVRLHPSDSEGYRQACSKAARHLNRDPGGLAEVYLSQLSKAIPWSDWTGARRFIRAYSLLAQRYPSLEEVERLQGMVLCNAAIIERIHGNYCLAGDIFARAIPMIERYPYPSERSQKVMLDMARLELADARLRTGQQAEAYHHLCRVEQEHLVAQMFGYYYYVQARYWLSVGNLLAADTWAAHIGESGVGDPTWPALKLELRADLALARNERVVAKRYLAQARMMAHGVAADALATLFQLKLDGVERKGPQ